MLGSLRRCGREMDLQPLKIERKEPEKRARVGRRRRWIGPVITLAIIAALLVLFRRPVLGFVDNLRLAEVKTLRITKSSPATVASATGTSANGYIVAKTRAALSADTPGRIVEMRVEEGTVVKKGDVVARLYSDEYAALLRRAEADFIAVQAAEGRVRAESKVAADDLARLRAVEKAAEADVVAQEAAFTLAEIDFHRAEKLLEEGVGSISSRDTTRSAVDSARARLDWTRAQLEAAKQATIQGESHVEAAHAMEKEALARLDVTAAERDHAKATLEKTEVRAPFDGIVVLKDAEVGEVVSPNVQGGSSARGSVATMVDFDSLEVQAEVPETSLAAVEIGRPATIYLDAFPDKAYPGSVDRIWPTANRTKATVEVRVAFQERDERLRPEMGVRVVFGAQKDGDQPVSVEPVVLIPLAAVVKDAGKVGVFVLERDVARFREIALGPERAGRTVVESGLAEGDTIVIDPPTSLADGDRVRVKG